MFKLNTLVGLFQENEQVCMKHLFISSLIFSCENDNNNNHNERLLVFLLNIPSRKKHLLKIQKIIV